MIFAGKYGNINPENPNWSGQPGHNDNGIYQLENKHLWILIWNNFTFFLPLSWESCTSNSLFFVFPLFHSFTTNCNLQCRFDSNSSWLEWSKSRLTEVQKKERKKRTLRWLMISKIKVFSSIYISQVRWRERTRQSFRIFFFRSERWAI